MTQCSHCPYYEDCDGTLCHSGVATLRGELAMMQRYIRQALGHGPCDAHHCYLRFEDEARPGAGVGTCTCIRDLRSLVREGRRARDIGRGLTGGDDS